MQPFFSKDLEISHHDYSAHQAPESWRPRSLSLFFPVAVSPPDALDRRPAELLGPSTNTLSCSPDSRRIIEISGFSRTPRRCVVLVSSVLRCALGEEAIFRE